MLPTSLGLYHDLDISCSRWKVKKTYHVCGIVKAGLSLKVHCQNLSLLCYNEREKSCLSAPRGVDGDAFFMVGMKILNGWDSSLLVKFEKIGDFHLEL